MGRISRGLAAVMAMLALCSVSARAGSTEPPVVKASDMLGRPYRTQTWPVPSLRLSMGELSIAELYRLTEGSGKPVPALTAQLLCEIDDAGTIATQTCQPVDLKDEGQRIATRMTRLANGFVDAPSFAPFDRVQAGMVPVFNGRPLPFSREFGGGNPGEKKPPFYRLASVTVLTDPLAGPVVDLATGPLVERQQLPAITAAIADGSSGLRGDIYPPRALRAEITGRETIECQVQADLSLICHMAAFDPPANAEYFAGFAENLFRRTRVDATLAAGQPAKGARFRFPINWAIPR